MQRPRAMIAASAQCSALAPQGIWAQQASGGETVWAVDCHHCKKTGRDDIISTPYGAKDGTGGAEAHKGRWGVDSEQRYKVEVGKCFALPVPVV